MLLYVQDCFNRYETSKATTLSRRAEVPHEDGEGEEDREQDM